jgi:CRP/FNR family transcriptional regulator, cyclic AMP receptor protein
MQTVEQLLVESTALAGLPSEHRATMAGCARLHVFYPGERLLSEGDPADEFFLIRRGAVAIETEVPGRGTVTLETLGPGEILGWSWLVPPYRSAFGARALDAVHVIALDGACLRGKCERDPALGFDLLKVVATVFVRRLEETRMRLPDLYSGVSGAG